MTSGVYQPTGTAKSLSIHNLTGWGLFQKGWRRFLGDAYSKVAPILSHFGGGGIMYFFDFLSNRRENRAERLRAEGREAERQFLRQGLEKEFAGDQGGMEKIEKVFNGR